MNKIVLGQIKSRISQFSTGILTRRKATGKIMYFCIGRNKTCMTPIKRAFEDLGYPVGDAQKAKTFTGNIYFERKSPTHSHLLKVGRGSCRAWFLCLKTSSNDPHNTEGMFVHYLKVDFPFGCRPWVNLT